MLGWHFIRQDRRFGYGDNNVAAPGYVYEVTPPIKMCKWGLHASEKILDALRYAPGPVVCRVRLGEEEWEDKDGVTHPGILHDIDKSVSMSREVLWMADATDVLRAFARRQALSVIHLWDAPDVVRRYLETGSNDLRIVSAAAAWDAASDAAWDAAASAARAAASDAAWEAAWAAASDAAWDAARAAAQAARAAAREAASDAARDAAWDAANKDLTAALMAMPEAQGHE